MSKLLSKIIRNAMASNAYRIGSREVLKYIDNSKLIICSKSVSKDLTSKLNSTSIPIHYIDKNSMELGKLCSKPFRVSIISIEEVSKEDLEAFIAESKANTITTP